jgi:hypothetical protein
MNLDIDTFVKTHPNYYEFAEIFQKEAVRISEYNEWLGTMLKQHWPLKAKKNGSNKNNNSNPSNQV